jgi:hypothetical protein
MMRSKLNIRTGGAMATMTNAMIQRREKTIQAGKEELAMALARTLVLLPYQGKCKCGLMLTERDKNRGKSTYTCPRCGKTGPLVQAVAK